MLNKKSYIIALFTFSFILGIQAQRFSFLTEVGGLRSQIEGDKIQGFYYNGYTVGIGSNYMMNYQNFLSIRTSFYSLGSTRKEENRTKLSNGIQLEMDLKTVGLELSYKYEPYQLSYFLGVGLVRHQLVDFEYDIITRQKEDEIGEFSSDFLFNSFTSLKMYFGHNVFKRAEIYLSLETSLTNLVKENFFEINALIPYSLHAVFTYEIIAPEIKEPRRRSGSKSRSATKIKKKVRNRPFSY